MFSTAKGISLWLSGVALLVGLYGFPPANTALAQVDSDQIEITSPPTLLLPVASPVEPGIVSAFVYGRDRLGRFGAGYSMELTENIILQAQVAAGRRMVETCICYESIGDGTPNWYSQDGVLRPSGWYPAGGLQVDWSLASLGVMDFEALTGMQVGYIPGVASFANGSWQFNMPVAARIDLTKSRDGVRLSPTLTGGFAIRHVDAENSWTLDGSANTIGWFFELGGALAVEPVSLQFVWGRGERIGGLIPSNVNRKATRYFSLRIGWTVDPGID